MFSSGVRINDDVVDHFERREIESPQVLWHMRPIRALADVNVGRDAGDENVGFALRVHHMAKVPGMYHVEYPVAHDRASRARHRADNIAQLFRRFDLLAISFAENLRHPAPFADLSPRYSNQVFVARAIEA